MINNNCFFKYNNCFFKFSVFLIFFFLLNININAKTIDKNVEHEKGNFIIEHVSDSHVWHFATIGNLHLTLPLPVILYSKNNGFSFFSSSKFYNSNHNKIFYNSYKLNQHDKIISLNNDQFYDISLTKNVIAIFISIILLLLFFIKLAKNYYSNKVPLGFKMIFDQLICFIRDEIAIPNIGNKYEKFMPYLLTVFFFIWLNNLLGLLPGSANVTGNISVTFVLALFTFFITNFNGNKNYWLHIFNPPGIPLWIFPIMIPIEIMGLFIKPFALTIRLFANMTAGHIILLSIINLIFIFENVFISIVSIPFGTFMFLLKILVSFLQAYVFTLLSSIYFGQAVQESH